MLLSGLVAAAHYLALGVGLGALFMRGRYIRALIADPLDERILKRLLAADDFWGLAAVLWVGSGLARAFGGLEKGAAWYLHNSLFVLKMILFAALFALEIWPMVTFIRWRIHVRRTQTLPGFGAIIAFRWLNDIELALVIAIVFTATLMARGIAY